jgi:hypothetical protein
VYISSVFCANFSIDFVSVHVDTIDVQPHPFFRENSLSCSSVVSHPLHPDSLTLASRFVFIMSSSGVSSVLTASATASLSIVGVLFVIATSELSSEVNQIPFIFSSSACISSNLTPFSITCGACASWI